MNEPLKDPIEIAVSLIHSGDKAQAESVLRKLVSDIPSNWKPIHEGPKGMMISFWDQEEFLSFVAQNPNKEILWAGVSYSKALYYLSFLAVQMQNWLEALKFIDKAIALEPDHPTLLSEKAMILGGMNNKQEAYNLYMKAMTSRPWASKRLRARAMRGAAVTLIDLHKIDEAESLLKESLQLDPESEVAKNELIYISRLRDRGASTSKYKLYPTK